MSSKRFGHLSESSKPSEETHNKTLTFTESPFGGLSVCPSVHLSVCPSVRLSVCPSIRLSICPSVRLSVCPSVRLSVCLSVSLSLLVVFVWQLAAMTGQATHEDVAVRPLRWLAKGRSRRSSPSSPETAETMANIDRVDDVATEACG